MKKVQNIFFKGKAIGVLNWVRRRERNRCLLNYTSRRKYMDNFSKQTFHENLGAGQKLWN